MKKRQNNKNSLYSFLDETGVLDSGNEKDISLARQEYWRKYKAEWRRRKRKEQKHFTVSLTDKEMRVLAPAAQKHHRSCTRFIKEAALAYCTKQFLSTDPEALNRIRELLALNYNSLQQLSEEIVFRENEAGRIMQTIEKLERDVLNTLQHPQSLEQWITETVLNDPLRQQNIIHLLKPVSDDN